MLKLKLLAIAAFLVFASCAFLFSNNRAAAQTGENNRNRDEILQKARAYKSWKQVQKPEKKSESVEVKPEAVPVLDSAAMG